MIPTGSLVAAPSAPPPGLRGALVRLHRWIAHPRGDVAEEHFELYAMTNWAMALGLVAHLSFIPLFGLLGVPGLALVNVASVTAFLFALYLSRTGHFIAALTIGSAEVVLHAWIATLWLGWATLLHIHAILALELLVLFTPVSLRRRVTFALIVAMSHLALVAMASFVEPWVVLSDAAVSGLAILNAVVFMGATTGMAAYHTWTVDVTRAAREAAREEVLERTRALEAANTELVEKERALSRVRDEAVAARKASDAASRAKSAFLANMSHELRTPLNSILGYSEMIEEEALDDGNEALVADARRIGKSGRHLLTLINDILDLSKVEAGKMEVLSEPIDLPSLVEEVVGNAQPLADGNGNRLVVEMGPDVGEMRSDPLKVRQILLNLISNACKFTKDGTVTIICTAIDTEAKPMIRMAVADTGIGMDEAATSMVFREFTQADGGTARKFGGTGLGLSITRRFCRILGGSIDVESTLGEGSTFTVWLPRETIPPSASSSMLSLTAPMPD